jgi:hypothetical protein
MKAGLGKGALFAFSVGFGLFGFGLSGCKTSPYCEELGKCGGSLHALFEGATDVWNKDGIADKEWIVGVNEAPFDACSDQLQTPPVPLSLVRQPPVQATDRPPDKVTADWCSNIVFKPNGDLAQFIVWAPPIPVKVGQLKMQPDVMADNVTPDNEHGRYAMQITYQQTRRLEFSESCLTSQGIRVTCPQLGRHLGKFLAAEANIYDVRCYDPSDPSTGGCLCDYELSFIGGPNGRWYSAAGSSQITFFDDTFAPPSTADYCIPEPNTLELTGHDTTALFNAKSLRTMRFHGPSCSDGIKSAHEDGVDCGPACNNTCGTCSDGMPSPGEEGIDCGGNCLGTVCDCGGHICDPNNPIDVAVPAAQRRSTCANGIQDPWEEGKDCGSFCPNVCP